MTEGLHIIDTDEGFLSCRVKSNLLFKPLATVQDTPEVEGSGLGKISN